ncbi:hypothetical protein [Aridibaculum aurantiacum]|uniref:hypothetical protein n=1 Tax=Aridibaculum aurantiacum TaxID=2810307 RepID=UPI001A970038|nr:hypothetical protein [Aridibaculum aurantiacum]
MLGLIVFLLYWFCVLNNDNKGSLFFLFLQCTSIFQLVPVEYINLPPVITKPYDWLCISLIINILISSRNLRLFKVWNKATVCFILFICLLLLYSLLILNHETKVSLSVFRLYLFFLLPILFIRYTINELQDALTVLSNFTVFACLIYIIQAFAGVPLLSSFQSDSVASNIGVSGIRRFYNMPFYTVFVVLVYFKFLVDKMKLKHLAAFVVTFSAVLLSFNRNTLIVALMSCLFIFFYKRRFSISHFVIGCVIAIAVFGSISFFSNERMEQGFDDITSIVGSSSFSNIRDVSVNEVSTTEFRLLHFYERFIFLLNSGVTETLLGIGLVSNQSAIVNNLSFNIGLQNDFKEVSQIDTGDIIWSVLILQVGIIGVLLFVSLVFQYIYFFLLNKEISIAFISGMFLLSLFISSFFSIEILFVPNIALYSMLYVYVKKLKLSNRKLN